MPRNSSQYPTNDLIAPATVRKSWAIAVYGQEIGAIVVAPQCQLPYHWEPETIVSFVRPVTSSYHDTQRIYLVGYSMFGYGTWSTAAARSEMFAAIAPIAGGGDTYQAKSLATVPILGISRRERQGCSRR